MPQIGLALDRTTCILPANKLADLALKMERLGPENAWPPGSFSRNAFHGARIGHTEIKAAAGGQRFRLRCCGALLTDHDWRK